MPRANMKDDINPTVAVQQDNHGRKLALICYWMVLLAGLPVWWMTTSIERHPLPTTTIHNLPTDAAPQHPPNQLLRVKGYPGYQISFTVISDTDLCVDLHAAYTRHFAGPLSALSESMAFFKVDQQCRLHAVPAGKTADSFLRSDWNLANSISSLPIINFLLYDGQRDHLAADVGKSFVYPQWGAVYVYDRTVDTPDGVMKVFLGQLMALLGISSSADLTAWLGEEEARCRRDALHSLRSLLHIISLSPNMPVPKQVSDAVSTAVSNLQQLVADDDGAMDTKERFGLARNALDAAEAAFFHPAMLARQYFPQEHILAVYVPLFVPLLMPLVVQTVKALRAS